MKASYHARKPTVDLHVPCSHDSDSNDVRDGHGT